MKILIIDTDNVGLSFAWRCQLAGHKVRWYVKKKPCNSPETGDGFKDIEKVDNFVPHMMWADLVFCTSNDDYLERMDFFRKKGARIFAPTVASANLEIKRKEGMEFMKKHGIELAPYEIFPSMKEAAKHVEKTKERWVFKTLGDCEDKALTYCSLHAADMLEWMDKIKEQGKEPKGEVMLQTFVKGIEMGVSRFMGSKGWVGQWNCSFEHKKVMSGNFGPNCGEAGTISAFTKESKLGKETLGKMEQALLDMGHLGDIAMGFMIDEKGQPWPTEFTCRFGWPIANQMLAATEGDPVSWMNDALDGKDTTTFKEDIGACVVLTHGDFPHGLMDKDDLTGFPIYGLTKGNKKYCHPQSIKIEVKRDMDGGEIVERPLWVSTGDYLIVVTGFGDTVRQACDRMYKTVDQLHVSNMGARDDIGEGLEKQLPKLHALGYAKHFSYEGGK